MAKDKSLSKDERKALKKAEKAKQESSSTSTLTEPSGVSKSKSDKKEKKDKKAKLADKIDKELELAKSTTTSKSNVGANGEVVSEEDEDEDMEETGTSSKTKAMTRPIGALVPFANPLADEKVGKKVFKSVKKAAAHRTLKRGVKEVVKALRKSPTSLPASSGASSHLPLGVVVLAADISPMDVISHIPVLCEDHNIPYIYVTSRAELGMAGQTKRPTSVVMVAKDAVKKAAAGKDAEKKKGTESDDAADWQETYKGLVKAVEREGKHVKV